MENKVLIKLIIPELDKSYDVYIPVNEVMWKIKILLLKIIQDLIGIDINQNQNIEVTLINKNTSRVYQNNEVVINTDIRNCTEIMLLAKY